MPLCPTKGGLSVRFATLDQNFFEDVNTQSSYLQEGAVHNGGHREGRQGAGAFFSVIASPEVLARECHHQVNPASEKLVCERDVHPAPPPHISIPATFLFLPY